jgi:hypothetical protein
MTHAIHLKLPSGMKKRASSFRNLPHWCMYDRKATTILQLELRRDPNTWVQKQPPLDARLILLMAYFIFLDLHWGIESDAEVLFYIPT